jgi:hypothetical protein
MKRFLLVIILLLNFSLSIKAGDDIIFIRNLFYRATKSYLATDSLVNILKQVNLKSKPESIGYKGMSYLMICFHSYNPYTKFKYFFKGKELLEEAIKKDGTNIELKFLRLTVQLNTPSFLDYKKNINEDKLAIFNGAKNITDVDLFNRIYNYTLSAKNLTPDEKKIMQQSLLSNKIASTINNRFK